MDELRAIFSNLPQVEEEVKKAISNSGTGTNLEVILIACIVGLISEVTSLKDQIVVLSESLTNMSSDLYGQDMSEYND